MVPIIVCVQVLLLCAGGAEPKIVYSRPFRNDAATTTATMVATGSAESAETDDDGATTAAPEKTTTVAVAAGGARVAAAAMPVTRSRYAEKDSAKSMSAKAEHYGIQFYAPPVIHGPAAATVPAAPTGVVDAFGRPVLQRHVHTTPLQATYHQHHHRTHHRPQQWDPTAAMVQQQVGQQHGANSGGESGSNPSLMNPLLAAYGDPSTVRYSPTTRTRPVATLVKYTEPTTLGFQLPFLAAEADDGALLENLPALQLALQHAASTGKLSSPSITAPSTAPLHHLYQQPHHHHKVLGYHQLHHQPHHHHHPHQYHYPHQHGHRYAPTRYTQVPFLYNVPAPPPLQAQRQPAPAEYDLVTRFNRLLKEREREGLRKGAAAAAAAAEQDQGQPEEAEEVAAEDEEEETTARPVQTTTKKPAKKKKRKRKRRPRPSTPEPAPVVEEEEEDDRPAVHQHDERSINEQEAPEEQESQNVPDHEKMPAETMIHESEADYQNENAIDGPSEISEHFGGDLTFDDSDGERVEFQLHGLGGPDSYKFGFDTGKGTNRQFRYEERDNGGYVRGHYGYLDQDGKMQVYNYSSHPELGFQSQKTEAHDT